MEYTLKIISGVRAWPNTPEEKAKIVDEKESAYVLKVAGIDQYLLAQCPITQYKYVRSCIARGKTPNLMMMNRKTMYDHIPTAPFHVPSYMRKAFNPQVPRKGTRLLWSSEKTSFRVSVVSANFVNVKEADQVRRPSPSIVIPF